MSGVLIDPVVKIPATLQQGDTIVWIDQPFTDADGQQYDSTAYQITFTIAGPFVNGILQAQPVSVTAVPQGAGWQTTIPTSTTIGFAAGLYQWQCVMTKTGFQLLVARGELTVTADISQVTVGYGAGLSQAELALAKLQAAYAALIGSNGVIPAKSYKIGMREYTYRDVREIESAIAYWNSIVINERVRNSLSQNQGNPRKRYVRFPSKFGSPAS